MTKKRLAIFLALIMLLLSVGCKNVTLTPTDEPTPEMTLEPTLEPTAEPTLEPETTLSPDMLFEDGEDSQEDLEEIPEPTPEPDVKPEYYVKIDVTNQVVFAYALDSKGEYSKEARRMLCSTGKKETATPLGTFTIPGPVARWGFFPKYDVWAQYLTRIKGSILFHSVLYTQKDLATLSVGSWYNIGKRASHGCIRLWPEDAKWIYDNCPKGTTVEVFEGKKNDKLRASISRPSVPQGLASPTPVPTPEMTPEVLETPIPEVQPTPTVKPTAETEVTIKPTEHAQPTPEPTHEQEPLPDVTPDDSTVLD